jgi:hypothetical protein
MATDDSALIVQLHQAKPKTSAERNRAFRQRQKERTAVRVLQKKDLPAQPVEKPKTSADAGPTFAELERTTAELMAACQRGMEAARLIVRRGVRR